MLNRNKMIAGAVMILTASVGVFSLTDNFNLKSLTASESSGAIRKPGGGIYYVMSPNSPRRAKFEMHLVKESFNKSNESLVMGEYTLLPNVLISSDDLERTTVAIRDNQAVLELHFTSLGKQKFAQLTAKSVGKKLAIVVDGKVVTAPVVRETITGDTATISGGFSFDELNQMARSIAGIEGAK